MTLTPARKFIKPVLILLLSIFSLNSFSQQTFTVVCDKTDNSVKVVESHDRSPNYVPIKGGFPFRQVAQKWIDENYTTTQCDPGEVLDQIKENTQNTNTQTKSTTPTPAQPTVAPSTPNSPGKSSQPATQFKNTSFIISLKVSNLGNALGLNKNLVPGAEIGLEQLIGTKFYFGTGILLNAYTADLESIGQDEIQLLYFGRIPAFVGFRLKRKNISISYETGVQVNSKIVSATEDKTIPGLTGSDNSFNLLGRIKIGSESILLEMGSEIWLSELFKDESFDMSSLYFGLRFYF